jgi:membrane associated rhomboid family serine protease
MRAASRTSRPLALRRPGADAPTLLAGILLLAWLAVCWAGGPAGPLAGRWYEALGLCWAGGLSNGRVWQLLTHALLHASTLHMVTNALFIYAIGARIDGFLGGRAMVGIFVAGSVLGSLVHVALPPLWLPEPPLVGASGGATALLLAFATLSPDSRMWPLPLRAGNVGLGVMLAAVLLAGLQVAFASGWLPALQRAIGAAGLADLLRIGHGYHFGGGLAGWLAARWVLRRPAIPRRR